MSISNNLKLLLKKYFPGIAYRILARKKPEIKHRSRLIRQHNINLVFDVGANIGLYAHNIRHMGYIGRIISLEPLSFAFKELVKLSANDNKWEAVNIALGNEDIQSEINISANSVSSSILDILPAHTDIVPESQFSGKENITLKKLDTIFNDYYKPGDNVFLKLDTQGFEKKILDGAENSLGLISGIQLEMSVVPLYENEMTYLDMLSFLNEKGFKLHLLESGWVDPHTGRLMQVDGIFFRD
jgi:FkbM family methyltransferase